MNSNCLKIFTIHILFPCSDIRQAKGRENRIGPEFIKGKKAVYFFIEIKPEAMILKDMEESLGDDPQNKTAD